MVLFHIECIILLQLKFLHIAPLTLLTLESAVDRTSSPLLFVGVDCTNMMHDTPIALFSVSSARRSVSQQQQRGRLHER